MKMEGVFYFFAITIDPLIQMTNKFNLSLIKLLAIAQILLLSSCSLLKKPIYKATTSSMAPTINIGDVITVKTKEPLFKEINRGDIVTFKKPDGRVLAYRVVGLPFDTVSTKNNISIVNSVTSNSRFIKKVTIDNLIFDEYEEELPSGVSYRIYKCPRIERDEISNFPQTVVPENCFFLIGDNRDNALDSRFKGPVEFKTIQSIVTVDNIFN